MSVVPEPVARRVHTARLALKPVRRSAGGALMVAGTAIVYDSPSPEGNLPFREVIRPGAFRDVLARPGTDLLLLFGHDRNLPLARQSAGNLKVTDAAQGLEFEAELVNTSAGRDAYELLRARVVKGCSFGFIPDPDGERWYERDGEMWVEVTRVSDLLELTLTSDPVYTQTDADARSTALAAIRRKQISARERSPYGEGSAQSWFADLYAVTEAARAQERAIRTGLHRIGVPLEAFGPVPANRDRGGVEEALKRMRSVPRRTLEARDVGTGALSGFADIPGGVPEFIVAILATAARAKTALADALPQIELPAGFIVPAALVQTTWTSTGTAAAVQTVENEAVSASDPDGTTVALKPATIADKFTVSRQLLERGSGVDELIARELGGAVGAKLEAQVVNGTGANGQLLGLLAIASIIASTYVDATPTQAELWPVLLQNRSLVATQAGEIPTMLALHTRRASWLMAALDTANASAGLTPPLTVVESLGIPTNLGGGSEDCAIVIAPSAVTLALRALELLVDENSTAGTLGVTFVAWRYAALPVRQPKGIAKITGTGLAAPAGY